ncbi:MAG: 3-deoxy-7-phosphoheptulonate synthase, partial [Spirochaetota bacterium]
ERGIKTFETSYRYSFDILASSYIKQFSKIPVIADPSHPSGNSKLVSNLALAAIAADFKGLIIEVHPEPEKALSDSAQQLSFTQFQQLFDNLKKYI